jgi:predicted aspartyl protease
VRIPYTVVPSDEKGRDVAIPVLRVQLSKAEADTPPGILIPAIVDTGATYSLFPAEIGEYIGLDVEDGRMEETIISNGDTMKFFVHRVRLWFGEYHLEIDAGFGDEVDFPVLGRVGFFDHFRITFDNGSNPPGFEITPIDRNHILASTRTV